jgi:hypothetical protein
MKSTLIPVDIAYTYNIKHTYSLMPLYHPFIKYVLLIPNWYLIFINFFIPIVGWYFIFVLYIKTILVYQFFDTRRKTHKTLLKIFETTKAR